MLITLDAERAPGLELLDARELGLTGRALRTAAGTLQVTHGAVQVSRFYSFPYALVGWHSDRIGVDIERVVECDEQFARSICTPDEAVAQPWRDDARIISLWSSKEALAKALGDAVEYDPRRLESPIGWLNGASGPWRVAELELPRDYRGWVCWRDSAAG
jgi:phosphopantetheinyl transferase